MFEQRWSSLVEPVFRRIGSELEASQVSALAQDGEGFLWIGTERGLVRWDGYRSRVFAADIANPDALHDAYITALYVDAKGTLWIGTKASGLARYDRMSDRFVNYQRGAGGFPYATVYAITGDRSGSLWVATGSGDGAASVDRLDIATGKIETLLAANGERDARGRALLIDSHGTLWVGTVGGLLRCERKICRNADGVDAPRINALYEGGDGTLWIGAEGGVYVMRPGSGRVEPFRNAELRSIQDFIEPVPGELWIASLGDGLFVVDVKSGKVRHAPHKRGLATTLGDNELARFLRDRSGLIWAGSATGLASYNPQSAILTVPSEKIRPDSASDTWTTVLLAAHDGSIWIGTAADGAYLVDPSGDSFRRISPKQLTGSIDGLAETSGKIFILDDAGLARTNVDGSNLETYTLHPRRRDALTNDILATQDKLWLLGFDGFWSLDPTDGIDAPVTRAAFSDRLSDQIETSAVWETRTRLWLGTKNGLNRIDTDSNTVIHLVPRPGDAKSLRSGFIKSLFFDRRHRLWVGTTAGLHRLESSDTDNATFEQVPLANLRKPVDVLSILQVDDDTIWVGTNDGIVSVNLDTLATRVLQQAEGVVSRLSNGNSACATPQGEMLFGGINGITVLRPNRLKSWDFRPPIAITDFRIGGKRIPAGRYADGTDLSPFVIAPGDGGLSVEFAALDFSAPERNRYAYRLDGFDSDWIDSDVHVRTASYSGLPPGDFTLRLRGSNRDGIWSEREVAIPIRILPPWYRTAWSFALYAALFALALWLAGAWRVRRVERASRILEKTVVERTAALASANAQLEESRQAAEAATQAKSAFLANMSHEIRTPMNAVLGFAQLGLRQPLQAKTLDYLRKIVDAGKNLLGIINDILDFSKIESGRLVLERAPFEVRPMLDQVRELFSIKAAEQRVAFSVTCNADVPEHLIGDSLRLSQVLINLIGNAMKFTRAGFVRVSVELRQRTDDIAIVHFAVEDSGIGMDEAQLARLFVPFSQADSSTTRLYGGTGLGLTISQRIVEQMGGRIDVRSALGKGSAFAFDATLACAGAADEMIHASVAATFDGSIAGARLLVAEDNPINQEIVVEILRGAGATIVVASTGEQAVRLATLEDFDCILMDIQMPDLDGHEATARIRRHISKGNIPIIAMTAHASAGYRDECLAAGMDDYVAKPIDTRALIETVHRWISSARSAAPVQSDVVWPGIDKRAALARVNGNAALLRRLLQLVTNEYVDVPRDIASAIATSDWKTAARLAHTIAGSAGNLSAMRLYAAAQSLEAACMRRDIALNSPLIVEFADAFSEIRATAKRVATQPE